MTEIVANDHDATVTTNDFALVANLLHAWLDLHDVAPSLTSDGNSLPAKLLIAINNATSGEVIWTEFNNHTIFGKDANVVLSHLAADMSKNSVSIS